MGRGEGGGGTGEDINNSSTQPDNDWAGRIHFSQAGKVKLPYRRMISL